MKILHIITGLSRKGGGPSRSSQGLVAAECAAGVDAYIWSFDGNKPWIAGVRDARNPPPTPYSLLPTPSFLRSFDLVHIHGIWNWGLHKACVACRKAGVPYVIAPRGMLEPWSLKAKWLKKRIARFVYQDRDLHCAAALHATAESEASQFRKLGFKNPVIISPNGVNVPNREGLDRRSGSVGESSTRNRRRLLFVSRMHPKKGVLELVEAWARIKQSNNQTIKQCSCELVYTVSGETEQEYVAKVKQRILSLGLAYQDKDGTVHSTTGASHGDFIFTGALDDDAKWDAYRRADLFVLPTYSENFGIVVAEALWAGVPVITTRGTPWEELETTKSGWWIDLPQSKEGEWQGLDSALREALALSDHELQQMGENGHRLVESKYIWSAVVRPVVEGYERVLKHD